MALGCGCAGGEAGRRAGAGETAMAGAAGAAAVGVNTVHLPAREGKASGGQPGGRRDESLAGGPMEELSGIAKRPAKPGGARAQSAEGIGALTLDGVCASGSGARGCVWDERVVSWVG